MTCSQREAWHQQLDDIADAYLDTALRRREPVTIVLRIDGNCDVLPAKVSVEQSPAQRMERSKA